MKRNRFIIITGPTATGKTRISVEIAKMLNSEIISADSMQIYRGMNIGTAKVTQQEMQNVPHHFIDIAEPDGEYSVAEFQKTAFEKIDEINARGYVPIVAGGTGLYVNSLVYDLNFNKTEKNDTIRQKYDRLADDKGVYYLYNILKDKDPKYASIIAETDFRRIVRRLEIIETVGNTDYNFRKENSGYDILIIGLTMERAKLYDRVNARVDEMMRSGLTEEVQSLYKKYGRTTALKAIGYKELIGHFEGDYSIEEAVRLIKRNTRRFAKRQMTWFKRDKRIVWFDVLKNKRIEDTINDIMICIKGKGF